MTAIKHRTTPNPRPARKRREDDDELSWQMLHDDLEQENDNLKFENRMLKRLVVQLSLGKLEAEQNH
jgi:hypothetical protein